MRFSANLGLLWRDRPLTERLAKAAEAGFGVVELHDDWAGQEGLAEVVARHDLGVAGLNTAHHGDAFGIGADPARSAEARRDVEAAASMASALGARAIHVLAGRHAGPAAAAAFAATLRHALDVWPGMVLVEPLSPGAVVGYHLGSLDEALGAISAIGDPRLKLMFDTYHIGMTVPDLASAYARVAPLVGHIQIAAVPTRAEPDTGDLDVLKFLKTAVAAGYRGDIGAEFRAADDAPRLDWLAGWQRRLEQARG